MKKAMPVLAACIMAFLMLCILKTAAQQDAQNKPRVRGTVVFELPGLNDVIVKRDIPYQDIGGSSLKCDIYYPPGFDFKRKLPAVIIVLGYTDDAGKKLLGSEFRNYIQLSSWCRLISASGLAAVVYQTVSPEKDIISLLTYLGSNEDRTLIDRSRIGAFTLSAHTPTAIHTILTGSGNSFRCAVVYYGFFLTNDFKYLPQIDSISKTMGFMTPRLPDQIPWKKDVPIMIVRAGKDNVPYINQSLAGFYDKALNQNLPVTLINYPNGSHAFDVHDDNETTKRIINSTLEFWKYHLKQ